MSKLVQDDEALLITHSQRGDVNAFNQLVLRYQQTIFGAAFRMLGDSDIAADVTQDTFLSAFRSMKSYRGGASFRAWLLRISSNLVYDHWRRIQRHPTESLDALTEEDESSSLLNTLTAAGQGGNPEQILLTKELQQVIQQGLAQLPLDQRTAIVLCDIQGLSYEEVAEVTQTALGTVRSRLSRGRARMRNYFYQHRELLPRNYRLTSSNE